MLDAGGSHEHVVGPHFLMLSSTDHRKLYSRAAFYY